MVFCKILIKFCDLTWMRCAMSDHDEIIGSSSIKITTETPEEEKRVSGIYIRFRFVVSFESL